MMSKKDRKQAIALLMYLGLSNSVARRLLGRTRPMPMDAFRLFLNLSLASRRQ